MSHLVVRELLPRRYDQAFPLARAVFPALTLTGWRDYLRCQRRDSRFGLLSIENERGVMLALAGYRPDREPGQGACLNCEPLLVFDLVGGELVVKVLIEALERQARLLGCNSLHSNLKLPAGLPLRGSLPDTALLRGFAQQGHWIEGTRLCKRLGPSATVN